MGSPARGRRRQWLFRALIALSLVGALAAYGGPLLYQLRGQRMFVIISGSMTGTFPAGTAVVVRPITPDQLAVGQVVTFAENDRYVTHRIRRLITLPRTDEHGKVLRTPSGRPIVDYYAQTKGDANSTPDPNLVAVGRVRYLVVGAYPHLGTALVWSRTLLGKAVLFLPPFLLLLGSELLSWRRPRRPREHEPAVGAEPTHGDAPVLSPGPSTPRGSRRPLTPTPAEHDDATALV